MVEELMRQGIFWQMIGVFATCAYVILVAVTLVYVMIQVHEMRRSRQRESALTVLKELQSREAREARRYIYQSIPNAIENLADVDVQAHLEHAEEAIIAFDRIGYLLKEGHIDEDAIMPIAWILVWRCWKRCESIVEWASMRRNDPHHLEHFRHFFERSEAYRVENNLEEPRIY